MQKHICQDMYVNVLVEYNLYLENMLEYNIAVVVVFLRLIGFHQPAYARA